MPEQDVIMAALRDAAVAMKARADLNTAYRIGSQPTADRALTKLEKLGDVDDRVHAALALLERAEVWWRHPQNPTVFTSSAQMAKALAGDNGEPDRVLVVPLPEPGK